MEYKLAREEHTRILNPYQSAYLLLDNGTRNIDDSVLQFRADLNRFLAAKTVHQIDGWLNNICNCALNLNVLQISVRAYTTGDLSR